MDNHDYCRGLLRDARYEAKEAGVKVPPISSTKMALDCYAVFLGDDWYEEYYSCCAFYARWEAINDYSTGERSPLNQSCEPQAQEHGQSPPQ